MKRILLLAVISIFGTAFVLAVVFASQFWYGKSTEWANAIFPHHHHASAAQATTPYVPPPPAPLRPLPDADAMAARVKKYEPLYKQVRDAALAAYAKNHPNAQPYDDEARAAIRLLAYLSIRGDYYGEALWQQLDTHAEHLITQGDEDTVWPVIHKVRDYFESHSSTDNDAFVVTRTMLDFGQTGYPPLIKHRALHSALKNIVSAKSNEHLGPALADMPKIADLAVQNYAQLIAAHVPNDILYLKGDDLISDAQDDETTLKSINAGLDKAFADLDPANVMAGVLDGRFYTTYAWNARGSGWSNTVSQDGWHLFAERLAKAEEILTPLQEKHPEEAAIDRVMMTVALGRQEPRDQMELWFQRGIKADPDNFPIYMAKRYYLLPRWYGSDQIVWDFGKECAASDNWSAKIPTILLEAIDDAAQNNPEVYADPGVWEPVEKVFRDYLTHYPDALTYRTRFFKCAVQGSHWDIAAEQLKLMDNDYDRDLLAQPEFVRLVAQLKQHSK